ncbi:MAG: glycosyltransferase family A protein [Gemmatimonadales bacterium]
MTVVSVSDPAATSAEEARRVGLAQAVGDVVYFVDADDLRTANRGPEGPDWSKELLAAGIGRPERPAGSRP